MKICQFTSEEMEMRAIHDTHTSMENFVLLPTPGVHAMMVLMTALETINQAGLDGKKLSNLKILTRQSESWGSVIYEIHADVQHRLQPR